MDLYPVQRLDSPRAKLNAKSLSLVFALSGILLLLCGGGGYGRNKLFPVLGGSLSIIGGHDGGFGSAPKKPGVGGVCLTPELLGRWVLRESETSTVSPVCCGWDKSQYLSNEAMCGDHPMPRDFVDHATRTRIYQGRKNSYAHMGGHACACESFHERYAWSSDFLPAWDAEETCKLVGDQKVLMIGDSTVEQAATTLMNAVFPAGCQTQMLAVSGDTLLHESLGNLNRGQHWMDSIKMVNPDIVIISAGAHIYGEGNFTMVLDSVVADIKKLRESRPNVKVVWKTQQPGGCTSEIAKVHPFDAARQLDWGVRKTWNHDKFFDRDLAAIARLQEHEIPIIDMRMLYSRTDAHEHDCLHMCSPGPLDVFPVLFQKLLQTNFTVSKCLE